MNTPQTHTMLLFHAYHKKRGSHNTAQLASSRIVRVAYLSRSDQTRPDQTRGPGRLPILPQTGLSEIEARPKDLLAKSPERSAAHVMSCRVLSCIGRYLMRASEYYFVANAVRVQMFPYESHCGKLVVVLFCSFFFTFRLLARRLSHSQRK
jgi:hypothetical protein